MPNIFEERENLLPYEYPELMKHKDAIRHSYWLDTEFNFTTDVNDFKVNISDVERDIISKTMLAISQIEVNVKSFWGDLYKRLPILEVQAVGATFSESECYDDKTEILTENGFKMFKDLLPSDRVAQYDIDSGEIDFTDTIDTQEYDYVGVMHHYESSGTDMMVTPNHNIVVRRFKDGEYSLQRSDKNKWGRNYTYPTCGLHKRDRDITDLERFLIAVQADGSVFGTTPSGEGRRDFYFNLKKEAKIRRIRHLLSALNIEYKEGKRSGGFTTINGKFPDEVDITTIKNFGFINLEEVGEEFCKGFLEELSYWDCGEGSNIVYYNTNEEAVDKVQAICTLGGISSNKGINRTKEESIKTPNPDGTKRLSSKDCYALTFSNRTYKTYPHRREVQYNGKVYCVTVPSGAVVTRRNRRVSVSGNSRHFDAYSRLLTVLGLEEEFKNLPEVPAIKGRISYLKKYLSGVRSRDNRTYTKSIILFSLFIENVSLFSQFLIIMSFNKERNLFKGMSNAVEATSKEEAIHGQFGADLVNIIRSENPSWFDEDMESMVKSACIKALKAEEYILDWIFEKGELDFLPKSVVVEFMKKRFNTSMTMIGYDPIFDVDINLYDKVLWFDEELVSTKEGDFFDKKQIDYNKKSKSITEDDIF